MSVRRLAPDEVQPASFAFTADNLAWAQQTIAKYPAERKASAVIPLLWRAQEQHAYWLPKAAIEYIADMLDMPYIRVFEVATFYTMFQLQPVGKKAHIQVCGTTPCMLRGAEDLISVCKSKIHHDPHHLNEDGTLSWEEVECLGACVNAPMIAIFKDTYEDLTATQLEHIIDRFKAGKGSDIKPGPQVERIFSAPAGGLSSLTEEIPPAPKSEALTGVPAASEQPAQPAQTPPSNAAKPDTSAPETDPKLKTPADGKSAEPDVAVKSGKPALDDPNRPAGVDKPEKPDDLQLISGIGPKIEATLNSIGIYTYAQVAAWGPAERDWVDGYLNFKGRIERDDWARQAKALADGGEEEYIRVFGKKPR